jgi:hypothetical protein
MNTNFEIPRIAGTKQEIETVLSELVGPGNYSIEESVPARPDDEELGFEPIVTGFLIGVATNVIADLLTELIKAKLAERKKK